MMHRFIGFSREFPRNIPFSPSSSSAFRVPRSRLPSFSLFFPSSSCSVPNCSTFSSPAGSVRHYRILFFGTDNVSLPTLKCLHRVYRQTLAQSSSSSSSTVTESSAAVPPSVSSSTSSSLSLPFPVTNIEVVCPSDRPAGRGQTITTVPVKQYAQEHGLRIHEVPYGLRNLSQWQPTTNPSGDIGVVVSFGYFLPSHLLQLLPLGAINMHPSLLPKYRGAAPIPHAILNGDTVTGVSIIEIHPSRFDAGSILLQESYPIRSNDTAVTLTETLAQKGAELIVQSLQNLETLREKGTIQTNEGVTRAPKLQTIMGELSWEEGKAWTVDKVWRSYRAFNDSIGIYTYVNITTTKRSKDSSIPTSINAVKRMNLVEIDLLPENRVPLALANELSSTSVSPGSFLFHGSTKQLYLRMLDGWIIVRQIQPEFKRVMTGRDFANGQHMVPNKVAENVRAVPAPSMNPSSPA